MVCISVVVGTNQRSLSVEKDVVYRVDIVIRYENNMTLLLLMILVVTVALREKWANTEFFFGPYFPAFGLNMKSISLYSVQMRENTDQKKLRIWTLFTQCDTICFVLI